MADAGAAPPRRRKLRALAVRTRALSGAASPRALYESLGLAHVHNVLAGTPLSPAEALRSARLQGLTLHTAENQSGFFGVSVDTSKAEPFKAQITRYGKRVHLGYFATAEQAALHVALVERDMPADEQDTAVDVYGNIDEVAVFSNKGRRGASKKIWKQKVELLRRWMEVEPGLQKWPRKASKRADGAAPGSLEAKLQSFVQTQREDYSTDKLQTWKAEVLEAHEWWWWKVKDR